MRIESRIKTHIKGIENIKDEKWKMVGKVYSQGIYYLPKYVYYISDKGRVFSTKANKLLKPWERGKKKNGQRYLAIEIMLRNKDRKSITIQLHRIVAQYFVPGMTDENDQVDHLDGNKHNSHASNLEWVDNFENTYRARLNNLSNSNVFSKMNKELVHEICKLFELGHSPKKVRQIIELDKSYTESMRRIYNKQSWVTISKHYKFTKPDHDQVMKNRVI